VGWIYTALRAHRKSLLVEEKLVGYRFDNTGGYRACELFGPTLSRVASEWLQDPDLVRMVLNGSIQRFFPTYLSKAKRGARQSFEQEDAHLILSRVAIQLSADSSARRIRLVLAAGCKSGQSNRPRLRIPIAELVRLCWKREEACDSRCPLE
jgi:hypothetical protein